MKIAPVAVVTTAIFLFFPSRAFSSAVVQQQEIQKRRQQQKQQEAAEEAQKQQTYQTQEPEVAEVVDMGQIWEELEVSSEIWALIMDNEPKRLTVEKYISWYAQHGAVIAKPSQHYVELIDDMARENAQLLKSPFKDVLKFAAIIEYDFNNGQNKDTMIKTILGERGYQENKKRLGM